MQQKLFCLIQGLYHVLHEDFYRNLKLKVGVLVYEKKKKRLSSVSLHILLNMNFIRRKTYKPT